MKLQGQNNIWICNINNITKKHMVLFNTRCITVFLVTNTIMSVFLFSCLNKHYLHGHILVFILTEGVFLLRILVYPCVVQSVYSGSMQCVQLCMPAWDNWTLECISASFKSVNTSIRSCHGAQGKSSLHVSLLYLHSVFLCLYTTIWYRKIQKVKQHIACFIWGKSLKVCF